MAAIAVEVEQNRASLRRRNVPREQAQSVGGDELNFFECWNIRGSSDRTPGVGKVQEVPLIRVKQPGNAKIKSDDYERDTHGNSAYHGPLSTIEAVNA